MSEQMIGPVSKRGDKLFGLAEVAKTDPPWKADQDRRADAAIRSADETLHSSGDAIERAQRALRQSRSTPMPWVPDKKPSLLGRMRRLRVIKGYPVEKRYLERATQPNKELIRRIRGGVNWRSSRPAQIIATEAQENSVKAGLKRGIRPRFPASRKAASINPVTGLRLNPEGLRYGYHNTNANEIYARHDRAQGLSKSFIPGQGWIPATKAGKYRLKEGRDLRAALPSVHRDQRQVPLEQRGAPAHQHPQNKELAEFNSRTRSPSGRKNVFFGPNVPPSHDERLLAALPKKVKRPIVLHANPDLTSSGVHAQTMARAGTRKPAHIEYSQSATPHTFHHEVEHANPRRSMHRIANINRDPMKVGREEARADVGAKRRLGPMPNKDVSGYEGQVHLHSLSRGNMFAGHSFKSSGASKPQVRSYRDMRAKLGDPIKPYSPELHGPMNRTIAITEPEKRKKFAKAFRFPKKAKLKPTGRKKSDPTDPTAQLLAHTQANLERYNAKRNVEKKGGVVFRVTRQGKPPGMTAAHWASMPKEPRFDYGLPPKPWPPKPKSQRLQLKPTGNRRQLEMQAFEPPPKRNIFGQVQKSYSVHGGYQRAVDMGVKGLRNARGSRIIDQSTNVNSRKIRAYDDETSRVRGKGLRFLSRFDNLGPRTPKLGRKREQPGKKTSLPRRRNTDRSMRAELDIYPDQRRLSRYQMTGNKHVGKVDVSKVGLRAIGPAPKPKAISAKMAPKPPANIRLVHSRPEQLGDRPRLKLPDYMRHLKVVKVDTTMSEEEAQRLAAHYDTRGPLPKKLSRETRMRAYEARYIASGGREGEKWQRRADLAETGRNIGLAGATLGATVTLAARNRKLRPHLARVKIGHHGADNATIGSAAFGGASELYGEHARSRRASFRNSPAGVAGSALSRMQAYTPEKKKR